MDEAPSNLSQASTLQANREDSMNILDPEDEEEHTQEEDSSGSNEDEDDSQDEEEEEEEDEEDDQVRGDCVWVGSDNLFHGNTELEKTNSPGC